MTALKIIVIILFVVFTILTVQIHPTMHNPMIIENANFKVERLSDKYTQKTLMAPVSPTVSMEQNVLDKHVNNVVLEKTADVTTEVPLSQNKQLSQPQQPPVKNDAQSQMDILQQLIDETQGVQPSAQPSKPVQVQPKPKTINPYMTEQEEIIAWNKWRSDIQNHIMKESNISADVGTMFLFTFVVDKYGNVSNINTWSLDPNYTPMAKRQIKPAISALQGQPILNFPRGTQRVSTIFTGTFLVAFEDRYSTPDNYSDYERVK